VQWTVAWPRCWSCSTCRSSPSRGVRRHREPVQPAYARPRELPPSDFAIGWQLAIVLAGVLMTVSPAAVLGQTISLV